MDFRKELMLETVIILANNFNPSIFSSHWLIKHRFCSEQDISPLSLFGPEICQVTTPRWQLLITNGQLQFTKARNTSEPFSISLESVLLPIIQRLPEVPYTALGLNFHHVITSKDMKGYQRILFFNPASPLHKDFDMQDADFGGYMSMNFLNTRLRLNVTPIKIQGTQGDFLQFVFNFHKDLAAETKVADLTDLLKNWNSFFQKANNIMNLLK